MFHCNLELPELDKIQTIKLSLPLFDVSQIDFMLNSHCVLGNYFYLLFYLYILYYFIMNI